MANETLTALAKRWNEVTSNLPWGVQRTFLESLKLVEEGQLHMAYSLDYNENNDPCLVNANANMLDAIDGVGGRGKPRRYFGNVVGTFDQINREFENIGFNKNRTVSADAAGFMVRHFSPVKTVEQASEEAKQIDQEQDKEGYIELMADADLMTNWLDSQTSIPEVDIVDLGNVKEQHLDH